MNILLVNDDGIESPGLNILVRALLPHGNVYVAAPKHPQSAMSQAISIYRRIECQEVTPMYGAKRAIAVDGYPADATRFGLKMFDVDFDLVVSGINNGVNIGKDLLYSGTLAAAIEAKLIGIPAVAVSAANLDLPYLYDEAIKLIDEMMDKKWYLKAVLNINFPKDSYAKPLGIKLTHQGLAYSHAEYVKSEKKDVFYIKLSKMQYKESDTSDVEAFESGYVSVTPVICDRTDYDVFKKMKL